MASQDDDNKLECISKANKEQERYYLNVYKKYEYILNNKGELFENKVESLIEVWQSIADLSLTQFDIRYVIQIIDWAKLHALNIVLTGEWRKIQDCSREKLIKHIEKAQTQLAIINPAFSTRCQKLADVVRKPWEDPVLKELLQNARADIGPKEIEFFCVETAYLVSVRLKKLCESQCEDLALNLVTNFLKYKKLAVIQNFNLNATETQIWFIFDIYIALLYKFQDKKNILENFGELTLEEGYQLVRRFARKRVKISKIWRNCQKIAISGSKFFLSKTLVKYSDDQKEFMTNLLKTYIALSNSEVLLQEFVCSVRLITKLADASGLCVMCEVIHREIGDKVRHFAIEMYIRALTTDMNELERLKYVDEEEKVGLTTSRLANTFDSLAELLDDHVKVSRECSLTAFSLEPTKERLKKLEDSARRSGFQVLDTGQEWKCKLHPPVLPSDDIAWMCPECGDWMCKPVLNAPVKMNMALNEALQQSVLGISEALCDDLVVCLSNPRYQVLSWLLDWSDLYRLCVMYLNDPEKTKNVVKELKYLDIDYSLFQHIKREPIDEFTGIEKGYEQYLDIDFVSDEENSSISEDSASQDRALSLGSDGTGDSCLSSLPASKSDPDTLKSLRMFRPNIKRKSAEFETGIPQKWHKSNESSPSYTVTSNSPTSLSSYLSNPNYSNDPYNKDRLSYAGNNSNTSEISLNALPESKNVEVATLPQLGGQVAINSSNQTIQVDPLTRTSSDANPIPTVTQSQSVQMPQKKSLHNGIEEDNSDSSPHHNYSLNTNRDCLLSTKQIFHKMMDFCKQNHNQPIKTVQEETQIQPILNQPATVVVEPITQMDMSNQAMQLEDGTQQGQEDDLVAQEEVLSSWMKELLTDPSCAVKPGTRKLLEYCKKLYIAGKKTTKQPPLVFDTILDFMADTSQLGTPPKPTFNPLSAIPYPVPLRCNKVFQNPPIHKIPLAPLSSIGDTVDLTVSPQKHTRQQILVIDLTEQEEMEDSTSDCQQTQTTQITSTQQEENIDSRLQSAQTANQETQPQIAPTGTLKNQTQDTCSQEQTSVILNSPPVIDLSTKTNVSSKESSPQPTPPSPTKEIHNTTNTIQCPQFSPHNSLSELEVTPQISSNENESIMKSTAMDDINSSSNTTQLQETDVVYDTQSTAMDNANPTLPLETEVLYDNASSVSSKAMDKLNPTLCLEAVVYGSDSTATDSVNTRSNPTLPLEAADVYGQPLMEDQNSITESEQLLQSPTIREITKDNVSTYASAVAINPFVDMEPLLSEDQWRQLLYGNDYLYEEAVQEVSLGKRESLEALVHSVSEPTVNTLSEVNAENPTEVNAENPTEVNAENPTDKVDKDFAATNSRDSDLENTKIIDLTPPPGTLYDEPLTDLNYDFSKNEVSIADEKHEPNKLHGCGCVTENNNISDICKKNMCDDKKNPCTDDDLPSNGNLCENIKKYANTHKVQHSNVPCFKTDYEIRISKISTSSDNVCVRCENEHQKPDDYNLRELRVVLERLPPDVITTAIRSTKRKRIRKPSRVFCDMCHSPPKKKSKKTSHKSETRGNNRQLSMRKLVIPLLDINAKATSKKKKTKKKKRCNCVREKKSKKMSQYLLDTKKRLTPLSPRVVLERLPLDNPDYARCILKNVPGLNDYELLRPTNVDQVVNVVQVSGGRPAASATLQNIQASTQVSPHIQRIGQPRVGEQKPIETSTDNNSPSATNHCTPVTSVPTVVKSSTSQSSTLINILSQQVIRPSQANVRRPGPLINIMSQQIIRPGNTTITQKPPSVTNNTTENTEINTMTKVEAISEQVSQSQIKTVNNTPKTSSPTIATSQGGTIVQFICKSSLPKFQQAFGKAVYQNSDNATDTITTSSVIETMTSTTSSQEAKKTVSPSKTLPVNVAPIQGNVIYKGQMPVGQTISLIPPGSTTRQLFRITGSSHEQISLVKETVIQNKMSALLAAALQGKPKICEQNGEVVEEYSATRITLCRPTQVSPNTRVVKPVQLQIPTNVIRSPQPNANVSSTTLEQLREFDMVYKQIKERSNNSTTPEVPNNNQTENQDPPQQRISFTYVNQVQKYTQLSPVVVVSSYNNLQAVASPAVSVTSQGSSSPCVTPATTPGLPKIASKTSKGKNIKCATPNNTSKSSPTIAKPQQKPQEDEHTTQRIFDILAEYAEQLRNSPDLNNKPAPRRRSNPPTNPSSNSKRKKNSSGTKKIIPSNSTVEIETEDLTMGSEDSSSGNVVQLSVTDDEQSQAASITPPDTANMEISGNPRQVVLTDANTTQSRNVIIADSSVGEALKMPNTALIVPGSYIMPVSMVKGTQQIAVVSGGSKILATVPARSGQNMLLFQSFLNQNKKTAISAVKYSAVQPISGISSQSIAGVSAQPPVILPSSSVATAVALGQPITLKRLETDSDRGNSELLLTISQPRDNAGNGEDTTQDVPQPDSSTSLSNDNSDQTKDTPGLSNEKILNYQKATSVATSVIATCIKDDNKINNIPNDTVISSNIITSPNKDENCKASGRMQSVLVNASNGPMLSHTNPRIRKTSDCADTNGTSNKESNNRDKTNHGDQRNKGNTVYYAIRTKKGTGTNKKHDSDLQKQAAMERELRLQKSLSEECEDLGVDQPSTSELFPEADLLFDSNHSPSYDHATQDVAKKAHQLQEVKEAKAMNLFSDDDNSGSLRTDIFDYAEYHTVETALDYQARQLMNGNNTSNESVSSCEDNTLLPTCGSVAEVTLNSPISPEMYNDNTQSTLNKYKYKYSNRKKGERLKTSENWATAEVSSSEDTVGSSAEVPKSPSEEDLSEANFKVVRVNISKSEQAPCQVHCDEDNKRGVRKTSKKPCSCCNGSKDAGGSNGRKRPTGSRPQTPGPHKKSFFSKKR